MNTANRDEENHWGLIHVYVGTGVGKSTRAVGLAVRAAGNGLRVDFVQFMKSGDSGEVKVFQQLPSVRYYCPGRHPFLMSGQPQVVHLEHARQALDRSWQAVDQGTDLLVCDEILDTLVYKILPEEEIMALARACQGKVEMVMTGRRAPEDVLALADYVTEFVEIKHPYRKLIKARRGIEY